MVVRDGLMATLSIVSVLASPGCQVAAMRLDTRATEIRETLTVEEVWETKLRTFSGCSGPFMPGCPAPHAPAEATARCIPANVCKALITAPNARAGRPDMLLDVVGLEPGKADVELRYRQPESDEWFATTVHLEFIATASMPTVVLNAGKPPDTFKFAHLSSELLAWGLKAPARCELDSDFHESYNCYGLESFGGYDRYPSSKHTPRERAGVRYSQFLIHIHRDDTGRITRIAMSSHTRGGQEQLGVWEQ
ncbi:MAG: hypothetical protein RL701_5142 [Pseudomonadota bacterium]|jgi:hypothetical protein